MRSAALYGALFVASAQAFQPTTSFYGRAFAPKAMSSRSRRRPQSVTAAPGMRGMFRGPR
jgi:hypothetical protein